jgi:hypothetical protein
VAARIRYTEAAHEYNVTVRWFPGSLAAMLFGFEAKPILKVEDEQTPAKLLAANFGAPVRWVGE